MKVNRLAVALALLVFVNMAVAAQTPPAPGAPVPARIGVDTAQQKLQEVSVTRFEDAGFWRARMPLDQGLVSIRRLEGGPAAKTPIEGEREAGIAEPDRHVVGVKVEFFRRSNTQIFLAPSRPLPIEGITKTVSVWVVGRNFNHTLKLVIEDMNGRVNELTMGKLNFSGWKQMTVAIPPNIAQRHAHYIDRQGIKILGFLVDCDLAETFGSMYMYFDDLRAVTDLFAEVSRDVDDMIDTW